MIRIARRMLKVDVDEDGNGGDDMYDMLRYGVMGALACLTIRGGSRGECG